jgi:tRNA(fMet)-specific endonuclease VapC
MGLIIDSSLFIGDERKRFDLAAFFAAHPQEVPHPAVITAAELLHGVERARPEHRAARSLRVEQFIASVEVIDFDLAVARRYAALWAALQAAGTKPDAHDLLIAARQSGLTMEEGGRTAVGRADGQTVDGQTVRHAELCAARKANGAGRSAAH